jgi:adenine-specific DNA methylase
LERKFKFIITDPPYYDDVAYPELLQFFQVWHHRTLGDLLSIPSTPSVSEEISVGGDRDEETFEKRLQVAIRKMHGLLDDDGVLTMFYAHSSVKGWKYVLEALRKVGFHVTSTVTLMTESEENFLARGKSSVFHSLVITARKRRGDKTTTIMDVEEEIRRKIEENYPNLEKTYGKKDRMNLIVAVSGMVIETITAYSDVTSFAKNTADYALEMGQRFLIEAFAKRTLDVDHADSKTMVYTWFRSNPIQDYIDFSEFNQTLKALGTGEEAVANIIERAKDDRSKVRLLDFSERGTLEIDGTEPLTAQSIIDAVHISLRAYLRGGITAAKDSVSSSPFGSKVILNTMDALSKIYATKGNYREGEVCSKFLEEWHAIYDGEPGTFKQKWQ